MKRIVVLFSLMMALAVPVRSQSYISHQDHFLTFTEAVALPGHVVLEAGTYLFRFAGPSQPGVVQVMSKDRKTVYAALSTIPVLRATGTGYTVTFQPSPAGSLPEIKAWFCEGSGIGHEFVTGASSPHAPNR